MFNIEGREGSSPDRDPLALDKLYRERRVLIRHIDDSHERVASSPAERNRPADRAGRSARATAPPRRRRLLRKPTELRAQAGHRF